MIFNERNRMPGVYIQEVDVAGPILGVATSTAAFIGPASNGPMLTPIKLTNWTEFKKNFGEEFTDRITYAPYAVKGFFENGGTCCYFVRVGSAKRAFCSILDKKDKLLFTLVSKQEGKNGDDYKVAIKDSPVLKKSALKISAKITSISDDKKTVTVEAAGLYKFAVEDRVYISQTGVNDKLSVTVEKVDSSNITLSVALLDAFDTSLAAKPEITLETLTRRNFVTLDSIDKIEPGSFLTFILDPGTPDLMETRRVDTVDPAKKIVSFKTPISGNFPFNTTKTVSIVSNEFALEIKKPDDTFVESFDGLSMDEKHSQCIFIKQFSSVSLEKNLLNNTSIPDNLPKTSNYVTKDGFDEFSSPISGDDFIEGIDKLRTIEDINMLCVPDAVNLRDDTSGSISENNVAIVHKYMIEHCQDMYDRFAIIDPLFNYNYEEIKSYKLNKSIYSEKGFGAMYYPWIIVPKLSGTGTELVPPSGHTAGILARADDLYGVHQAPAGEFLPFRSVLGVERELESAHHGQLNEEGINVIRILKGIGAVIWGARTIAPHSYQWRYVNVRRLLLYIEKSILESTRSLVFKPNNKSLWQTIKRQVTGFLTNAWRNGALVGDTADKAFSVKVDEEINTPETMSKGLLYIEVKLYPTTPAEFIVFQVIQQPGGPIINE